MYQSAINTPIAYVNVSEVHWYDPDVKHKGVQTVLRQNTAHLIGGRNLANKIKRECIQCRILHKKSARRNWVCCENNLTVANCCQVDICGPFNAYSSANERATLKLWLVVFVVL